MNNSRNGYGSPRRRGGCALMALLLVVLLVVGVVGAEFYVRKQVEDKIAQAATSELHSPTTASVNGLALLLLLGNSVSSVDLHSEGGSDSGQVAPAIDVTLHDVAIEGESAQAGSLEGKVSLSAEDMLAAAQESNSSDGGFFDQFTQVQSITPDPGANALQVSIGGVADTTLVPEVRDGALEFAPQDTQVLGIQIPENLLGGTISMVNETVDRLPEGVSIDAATVTDGGMDLQISGQNVPLRSSGR